MFYPKAMDILFRTMAGVMPGGPQRADGSSNSEDATDNENNLVLEATHTSTQTDGEDYVELIRLGYDRIRALEGKLEEAYSLIKTLKDRVGALESENHSLTSNHENLRLMMNDLKNELHEKSRTLLETYHVDKLYPALENLTTRVESSDDSRKTQAEELKTLIKAMDERVCEHLKRFENFFSGNQSAASSNQESLASINANFLELKRMMEHNASEQNTLKTTLMEGMTKTVEDIKTNQTLDQQKMQELINTLSKTLVKDIGDCGTSLRTLFKSAKGNDAELVNVRNQIRVGNTTLKEMDRDLRSTKARLQEMLQLHREDSEKFSSEIQNLVQKMEVLIKAQEKQQRNVRNTMPESIQQPQPSTSRETQKQEAEAEAVPINFDSTSGESSRRRDIQEAGTYVAPVTTKKKRRVTGAARPNSQAKRLKRRASVDNLRSIAEEPQNVTAPSSISTADTQIIPISPGSTVFDTSVSSPTIIRRHPGVRGSALTGSGRNSQRRQRKSTTPRLPTPSPQKPQYRRPSSSRYSFRTTPQINYADKNSMK